MVCVVCERYFHSLCWQKCNGTKVFDIPLYRHLFGPDYVENSTEFHHRWIVASAVLGNKEVLQNYPFFLFDDELDANEVMSF